MRRSASVVVSFAVACSGSAWAQTDAASSIPEPEAEVAPTATKPDPSAISTYRTGRVMGKSGLIAAYAGVGVGLVGAGMLVGAGSLGDAFDAVPVVAVGGTAAFLGAGVLASGSVLGASGVRRSGADIRSGAGWTAAGGVGAQLAGLGLGMAGVPAASILTAGGFVTTMVAGHMQHARNQSTWKASGHLAFRGHQKVQLSIVPTASGGALAGRW